MKVIATGGSGFIGSHLVERLIKENFELSLPNHLYNILIYLSIPGTLRKESDDADRLAYTIILLFKYLN